MYLRKDKLAFAVDPGAEEVNDDDDDETYGDPCRVVDRFIPEINQDSGRAEFGGEDDCPVVPIIPALRFWSAQVSSVNAAS